MLLENGDLAAIHTLACAAREIYEKHCERGDIDQQYYHYFYCRWQFVLFG